MGVYLREKKLKSGKVSMYLDIFHNENRWYEFLEIHINKNRPSQEDKEKKRLALEIRSKRENELIVQDNGLLDRSKRKADFVVWYENHLKTKAFNTHTFSTLQMLKKYVGKTPLPFSSIHPLWIKGFANFMLGKVSNNTARCYLMDMFTGLEDAVVAEIIPSNPFRKIPKHERLKKEDIFRNSYTLEQLQILVETPCAIEPQIKEGFLFACFTGLRWSDVNQLMWKEVITKKIEGQLEYFIYFDQQKTKGIEYLPLSDQAVEIIKNREKERKENNDSSPYVFPLIVEYNKKLNLRLQCVTRALRKWAKVAGLDPKMMHFHASRHTFATNVLESSLDGDLYTVSKLLGHKSIIPTQIYAHVKDAKKSAAVKSLPKLKIDLGSWKKAA